MVENNYTTGSPRVCETCSSCGGRGGFYVEPSTGSKTIHGEWISCSNCNGTGYVFDGSTTAVYARSICGWCRGIGKILFPLYSKGF